MSSREVEGKYTIDLCTVCGGVWIDSTELQDMLQRPLEVLKGLLSPPESQGSPESAAAGSASAGSSRDETVAAESPSPGRYSDEKPGDSPFKCPRCDGEMERYIYAKTSQVLVDACKMGHGVWFDEGELEEVVTKIFMEHSVDPPSLTNPE